MAYDQDKPYAGEFPCESAAELDDQAVEIIVRNLQAGRSTVCAPCNHLSQLTPDGHGAYCVHCGEGTA